MTSLPEMRPTVLSLPRRRPLASNKSRARKSFLAQPRFEALERRTLLDASDYAVRWAMDEGVGATTADLPGRAPAATIVTAGWSLDTANDRGFALGFRGGDR